MSIQSQRKIPVCAPRRSGLSRLQLALLGKGPARRLARPMTQAQADEYADRKRLKGGAR